MQETIVRLESISIENFKNVKNGQLSFANNRKAFKTSILGLYGRMVPGKTALIEAPLNFTTSLKRPTCSRQICRLYQC